VWRVADARHGRLFDFLGIGLLVVLLAAVWIYMKS
jgi:hypothetical protein